MSNKDIKLKLRILEIIIRIATVILYFLELYITARIILYLKDHYFYLGLIAFFIAFIIFTMLGPTDFKKFEEEEVEKWEELTFKRTIKFAYKYHRYAFNRMNRMIWKRSRY